MVNSGICVNFNGANNSCCKANVNYRAQVGGDIEGWMKRIPCIKNAILKTEDQATCARYEETKDNLKFILKKAT